MLRVVYEYTRTMYSYVAAVKVIRTYSCTLSYPGFINTRAKCSLALKSNSKTSFRRSCKKITFITMAYEIQHFADKRKKMRLQEKFNFYMLCDVIRMRIDIIRSRCTFSPMDTPPDVTMTSHWSRLLLSWSTRLSALKTNPTWHERCQVANT